MKSIEILASFYSLQGLRDETEGLAIVACALLIAGFLVWRVTRFRNEEDTEELERERRGENIP